MKFELLVSSGFSTLRKISMAFEVSVAFEVIVDVGDTRRSGRRIVIVVVVVVFSG